VIDTFFVFSNEEENTIWHFSIVMLKEATQKHTQNTSKATLFK